MNPRSIDEATFPAPMINEVSASRVSYRPPRPLITIQASSASIAAMKNGTAQWVTLGVCQHIAHAGSFSKSTHTSASAASSARWICGAVTSGKSIRSPLTVLLIFAPLR